MRRFIKESIKIFFEDDESTVEWTEGRFSIGFGKTPIEAYEDWSDRCWRNYES